MLEVIEVIDKRRWLGSHQSGGEWMTSISLWNRDPWGCVVNFKVPFCSLFTFPLQEKLNILYIFMLYDFFFLSSPWTFKFPVSTLIFAYNFTFLILYGSASFLFHSSFSPFINFLRSLRQGYTAVLYQLALDHSWTLGIQKMNTRS